MLSECIQMSRFIIVYLEDEEVKSRFRLFRECLQVVKEPSEIGKATNFGRVE